ncbi:hypothetical protein COY95_04325, partial [Candidatus Woesearchaeota archaeon CG_4_10_14_0_8_um_filter_47_5]
MKRHLTCCRRKKRRTSGEVGGLKVIVGFALAIPLVLMVLYIGATALKLIMIMKNPDYPTFNNYDRMVEKAQSIAQATSKEPRPGENRFSYGNDFLAYMIEKNKNYYLAGFNKGRDASSSLVIKTPCVSNPIITFWNRVIRKGDLLEIQKP